jgi:hypothetical protein
VFHRAVGQLPAPWGECFVCLLDALRVRRHLHYQSLAPEDWNVFHRAVGQQPWECSVCLLSALRVDGQADLEVHPSRVILFGSITHKREVRSAVDD